MMNRIKSVYRSWAIPCAGTSVYSRRHRAEGWPSWWNQGVRIRAEHLYEQLDSLEPVRQAARRELLRESRKHAGVNLLRQIPAIGPIRSALLDEWVKPDSLVHGRLSSSQFEQRDLWSGADSDRETGSAYSAVDVELPARFLEPSADVASFYSGEGDTAVDELELAAVGVPGQGQVDAQLRSTIKGVGIVAQKDVDHPRHHQFFVPHQILINVVSRMIVGESQALVVNTNQVQHFAARLNRHPLLTQNANPLRGKKSRDGILGLGIDLMVAEATEDPVGRTKTG